MSLGSAAGAGTSCYKRWLRGGQRHLFDNICSSVRNRLRHGLQGGRWLTGASAAVTAATSATFGTEELALPFVGAGDLGIATEAVPRGFVTAGFSITCNVGLGMRRRRAAGVVAARLATAYPMRPRPV